MWSDEELIGVIEAEEATAVNWADGTLSEERAEAFRRYNGELYGDEQEGRSQVIASDVRDAVEGVMPSLARVFLSGDEIGKFEPIAPSDEGYEIESQVCNWIIFTKNDGFNVLYSAIKESLLTANSYVKVWWQKQDVITTERYEGLSDEEAQMIAQDKDVEIVSHEAYPDPYAPMPMLDPAHPQQAPMPQPMLHNIKVARVRPDEYVAICPVPPDELLVSGTHREVTLANADFVQHRRSMSIGEVVALGYEIPDDLGDETEDGTSIEELARNRYEENLIRDDSSDPSRRRVTLRETWIRLGDKDNQQTLWRVCTIGRKVLHKEEADCIPIAAFAPIYYPHSHVGISFFSLIADVARIKTTVQRQYLDNLYLANNQRSVVDVNRVNIDDLLISRPGGIVRVEGEPSTALMPIVAPDVGGAALGALEWLDSVKENRTGVARVNQGTLDPNSLNRTATGASLMMSAGQARLELIARCLAGGVRDLFLLVHAIAQKHSTKPLQLRLKNKWITSNPREWARRTDFSLSVALGTGAPEQQLAKLQMVGAFMQQGMGQGLVTRENLYNWAVEFLKTAGYKSPDKFVTAPDPQKPPPQQTPPEVQVAQINVQGITQAEQIKQQGQAQGKQMEIQAKSQADMYKAQQDAALAERKMQQEMQLEQYRIDSGLENAVKLKLIEVAGNVLAQSMAPQPDMSPDGEDTGDTAQPDQSAQMQQIMAVLTQTLQTLASAAGAPRRIVRGPDGRAMGVETVQAQ